MMLNPIQHADAFLDSCDGDFGLAMAIADDNARTTPIWADGTFEHWVAVAEELANLLRRADNDRARWH